MALTNQRKPAQFRKKTAGLADLSDRELEANLRERLAAVGASVDAFLADPPKGVVGGERAQRAFEQSRGRSARPLTLEEQGRRDLFSTLDQLVVDAGFSTKLKGGAKRGSGAGGRSEILADITELRKKLGGAKKSSTVTSGDISGAIKSLDYRQLLRDARVAETGAQSRNALARRRNQQLTPGTTSELRRKSSLLLGVSGRTGALR